MLSLISLVVCCAVTIFCSSTSDGQSKRMKVTSSISPNRCSCLAAWSSMPGSRFGSIRYATFPLVKVHRVPMVWRDPTSARRRGSGITHTGLDGSRVLPTYIDYVLELRFQIPALRNRYPPVHSAGCHPLAVRYCVPVSGSTTMTAFIVFSSRKGCARARLRSDIQYNRVGAEHRELEILRSACKIFHHSCPFSAGADDIGEMQEVKLRFHFASRYQPFLRTFGGGQAESSLHRDLGQCWEGRTHSLSHQILVPHPERYLIVPLLVNHGPVLFLTQAFHVLEIAVTNMCGVYERCESSSVFVGLPNQRELSSREMTSAPKAAAVSVVIWFTSSFRISSFLVPAAMSFLVQVDSSTMLSTVALEHG